MITDIQKHKILLKATATYFLLVCQIWKVVGSSGGFERKFKIQENFIFCKILHLMINRVLFQSSKLLCTSISCSAVADLYVVESSECSLCQKLF